MMRSLSSTIPIALVLLLGVSVFGQNQDSAKALEAAKISLLALTLETGFPKGRGKLRIDRSIMAAQAYKLPKLLGLTPLGTDNIDDPTKIVK